MTNLPEKLELMQWLSERGFEPAMWYYTAQEYKYDYSKDSSDDGFSTLLTTHIFADRNELPCEDSYYIKESKQPWFPLEQVLELLPDKLHTTNLRKQEITYRFVMFVEYMGYQGFNNGTIESKPKVDRDGDNHLCALKLLKQVAEQYPENIGEKHA